LNGVIDARLSSFFDRSSNLLKITETAAGGHPIDVLSNWSNSHDFHSVSYLQGE
jgi:hypothetical protein